MAQLRTPIILLAFTAGVTFSFAQIAAAAEVVDPVSGETVDLSEIDFTTLTRSDARDIMGQLKDQGYTRREARQAVREERRADIGALEVTDPTTGETTTLSEIDRDSLSEDDRADIAEQLAEAGVTVGPRGGGGDRPKGRDRGRPDPSEATDTE